MVDESRTQLEPSQSGGCKARISELSAGEPAPAKDVAPDKSVTLGSAVRIPMLLGLAIAALTAACLGIPMTIYFIEDALGAEFSDEFVDLAIGGGILLVFMLLITYATGRHRLRNWLAEGRLAEVQVDVGGRREAGEKMKVSVTSRHLCRARAIEISREVIRIDGLSPDDRAEIVATPEISIPKHDNARARPVLGAGDSAVASRDRKVIEPNGGDALPSTTAVTFPITEELVQEGSLFQRLHIEIEFPWWWFDWSSKVMIWESNPEPGAQMQSAAESASEEPVW